MFVSNSRLPSAGITRSPLWFEFLRTQVKESVEALGFRTRQRRVLSGLVEHKEVICSFFVEIGVEKIGGVDVRVAVAVAVTV